MTGSMSGSIMDEDENKDESGVGGEMGGGELLENKDESGVGGGV